MTYLRITTTNLTSFQSLVDEYLRGTTRCLFILPILAFLCGMKTRGSNSLFSFCLRDFPIFDLRLKSLESSYHFFYFFLVFFCALKNLSRSGLFPIGYVGKNLILTVIFSVKYVFFFKRREFFCWGKKFKIPVAPATARGNVNEPPKTRRKFYWSPSMVKCGNIKNSKISEKAK